MNNMPGDYLSNKEVKHPDTSRTTEKEKLLNEKQVRQKHDVTKKSDKNRRNKKNFWENSNKYECKFSFF